MISTKRSIGITFFSKYVEFSIQFIGVLILARLLTPADTGIFSVAAFLMALLHVFRDFGVANYLIQEEDLTTQKIQSAYGVALLLAFTVAAVMYLSSDFVTNFYNNPKLKNIMHVMALSFAVSPFGSLLLGILKREMQFKSIFFIQVSSAICHVAVATVLAVQGYGALSLAWANFAGILSFGLVANIFRPKYMPWWPSFRQMGRIISFGGFSSIANSANTIGSNMPDLVIAKVLNMESVGYFSRGNGLVLLFGRLITSALDPVILPLFSRINRSGTGLKLPYINSVEYLTALSWPFFGVMSVLASPIVYILYGPQWGASVPFIKLLCIAGAVASVSDFADNAMVASGKIKNTTFTQLLSQSIRIASVIFAAQFGLFGIALAMIFSELLTFFIVVQFLHLSIHIKLSDILIACRKSAIITIFCIVGPILITFLWHFNESTYWILLFTGAVTALAGWVTGIYLTRHPLLEHMSEVLPFLDRGSPL